MCLEKNIDIKENELLKIDTELLAILLKDKTTGNNIIWATDNYSKYGFSYTAEKEIKIELITSRHGGIIKPRVEKSKEEQQRRVRQKAEVFTPTWICNMQNNQIDKEWFGRKDVFNFEKEKSWEVNKENIAFPENKTWHDYVLSKRLEMSCGEAPYITSRYDAVTGEFIEVQNRIGILDRKLRIVNENIENREDWIKWAYSAVQNVYGFDWQGDNVLIARENLLFTIAEHYEAKFGEKLETQDLLGFAKVIAWNIWQMDGIKYVIPNSCSIESKTEETLFETIVISKECVGCKKNDNRKHNGIYCKIKDWETHRNIRFVDMVFGGAK
ncbi:restriction endonuclease subunit M [uncultured Treponema sp.]|uniref:restriction endonuclease subunit M n=1 Tax=uncultured Treponema sp. TaxID=162155 RepID=UPI0025E7760D|nr:restriction endonuclease subunit M [uncultured Treponema sp.]